MYKHIRNGWQGQAMAEYVVKWGFMAILIIVALTPVGHGIANSFRTVSDGFDCAQSGEGCEDLGMQSPQPAEQPDPDPGDPSDNSNTTNPGDPSDNSNTTNPGDPSDDSNTTNPGDPSDDGNTTDPSDPNDGIGDSGDDETPNVEDSNNGTPGSNSGANYQCPPDIDFNSLAAGTILTDQFEGVTISTMDDVNHPAMIFDSSNPSGGDWDLGTPNERFGGPGRMNSNHGSEAAALSNDTALGNLIIISEDGDTTDPDDNSSGGTLYFDFEYPAEVSYMYFVDADNPQGAALVTLRDQAGNMIAQQQIVPPPGGGDNGVFRLDFDQTGVYQIEVFFNGVSGAIASVFFCEPPTTDDDTVTTSTPPFALQCDDMMPVIIEPRENNAQHVMVQYPVECDANGNYIPVEAGTSTIRMSRSNSTYFRATLSGHLTGSFDAWCVDYDNPISYGRDYTGDNYGSTDVSVDRPENLPLVAWLINANLQGQGYSVEDIQGAIWLLTDDTPILRSHLGELSEELVVMAEQNAGDSSTNATVSINEDTSDGSTTQVTPIFVNQSATGTITSDSKWAFYSLNLQAGELVDIDLESLTGIDPYLRVYNSDGTVLLAENDDISWPGNSDSRITDFTLTAGGTVVIQVATYNDNSTGEYRLTVTGEESSNNNSGNNSGNTVTTPVFTGTAITGLTWIDTSNNSNAGAVTSASINLSDGYGMRADTTGSIGSVRFFINGEQIQQEHASPYAIAGDSNGNFNSWNYAAGTYTLEVIAYSERNGGGSEIGRATIEVTIEN